MKFSFVSLKSNLAWHSKMNRYTLIILILFVGACVDRIDFNIGEASNYAIAIDGFISDQPGPYLVNVNRTFDIESKLSVKTPLSVRRLVIHDNEGTQEQLTSIAQGVYQTDPNGIRGEVGKAYKLEIELLDGRVYESIPDTLMPSGLVDSVYFKQSSFTGPDGSNKPSFDIYFDSSVGENDGFHYLWKFVGTYQIETNPELYDTLCVEGRCPKPKPCSGYRYDGSELTKVRECECCTCWVDFFNDKLVMSDNEFIETDKFTNVKAGTVPINAWTFMHKVHAEVRQMSLSPQAFAFWKAVKAQKESISSLFQPVSGKVASNFFQLSGKEAPIEGIFYATSIRSKSIYITPFDVHPQTLVPPVEVLFINDCRKAFPYSKTERPSYWN